MRKTNDGKGRLGGRKKGTPNKVTADLRIWVNEVLNNNKAQFVKDLAQLEPHQRVAIIEKLLSYALPKMQAVEAKIDYSNLSDEQLEIIINELKNSIENED